MGKYTLKMEDVIEGNSDPDLEYWERDEESKYWIHRTMLFDTLYFNPNFKKNGCPLILTGKEMENYLKLGKEIVDCSSISVVYDDEEVKSKVLSKLEESGLTLEDFEEHIVDKISPFFKSFFETGIYMPDVYDGELERTANQLSPERMRKIISRENFGFNGFRGDWNTAVILEIPLDEQKHILEELAEPIEYGTEYYGITKISKVVSPKYIKGIIVKFGQEVMFIKNAGFEKKKEPEDNQIKKELSEEEMYLYYTEELFNIALQRYMESELPAHKKAEEYVERVSFIESQFRKYARQTTGFVASERHRQVYEFLQSTMIFKQFKPDTTKGNYVNMVNSQRYYTQIAKEIDLFILSTNNIKPNINEENRISLNTML